MCRRARERPTYEHEMDSMGIELNLTSTPSKVIDSVDIVLSRLKMP